MRREADLRLISTRIAYLDDLECTLPLKLRHYIYIGYHTVTLAQHSEEVLYRWKYSLILLKNHLSIFEFLIRSCP